MHTMCTTALRCWLVMVTSVCLLAAAGALIYQACRKAGLGRELPTEWFGADVSEWTKKGLPAFRVIGA